jgi:signal transduction histidine kinase
MPHDPHMADDREWLASHAPALASLLGQGDAGRDLLAALLDAIPDGIRVVDRDGRQVYANRAFRERFGPMAAGASLRLDAEAEATCIDSSTWPVLADGRPMETVQDAMLPDGRRLSIEHRATPIVDRDGRVAGALLIVRDATARVAREREVAPAGAGSPGEWSATDRKPARYEAQLQQAVEARTAELARAKGTLRRVLDGIPDAIALLDPERGSVLYRNSAAEALPEGARGLIRLALCKTSLLSGRTVTRLVEHPGPRGERRVFEAFAYPVPSVVEGRVLAIAYARDVTDRLALERQAIRNERLAVVGELAAGLAHEIRTPLTSISNSVKLLEGALPADAGPDARLVLKIIAKESKRLSALLADFLKFARPRAPRPVPTDLNALVREAVRIARGSRPQAESVPVDLELAPELPEAPVDPDQMQQALLNIVVNALEATQAAGGPRDGTRRVVVGTAGPRQGRAGWEIRVADGGPGIDAADRARIFEPFFSRKSDGTGLGLAITKRIVEAHAGRIEAADADGGGAVFTIHLPAASGAAPLEGA